MMPECKHCGSNRATYNAELKTMAQTPEFEWADSYLDRAVHNSPPPLDDVGGGAHDMLDEKDPTSQLLNEREKTHGDYAVHAAITQGLKMVMRRDALEEKWRWELDNSQREALEMIAHKIGRILAGDPNHADHWDDIAGYAKLVSIEITSRQE